jgi:hypothetical protein
VDCDVVHADENTEKVIKRSSETATFHTVIILKDVCKYPAFRSTHK